MISPPNQRPHVVCLACFRGHALIGFLDWFIPYVTLSWFEREKALEPHSWFPGPFFVLSEETMATKLFVGNLSFNATPADLETLFGQAGVVSSVTIISDKFTGQSRGFGF